MATYYWVGGSGTWDTTSTTNWSATSGGAGGAGVPNSADIAILDAASGTVVVTLGENVSCLILTCTGFTGTLAFGANKIIIAGNGATIFTQSTTMTVTGTPVIDLSYAGATSTRTISISNVTEANSISYNVIAGTDVFAHTNLAGIKNLNFTGFGGIWTNTSFNLVGNLTLSTGMTVNAGATPRSFTATSGVQEITTNGKTLDFPLTQNGLGGTLRLKDNLTMGSARTFTLSNGILDLNTKVLSVGNFNSNSNSTIRTINFNSGSISVQNNSTTVWNTGAATGLTVTGDPIVNFTYAGSTGTRTLSAGGGESRSFTFNVLSGSDIITNVSSGIFKNLNFTGFSGTFANVSRTIFGSLVLSSGMTLSTGTNATTFGATTSQQITTANLTLDFPLVFNGVGGTFAFQDALTQGATRDFTITNGTVQLKNGATSTVGNFVANNNNVKFLQSTTPGSQATLSQAAGTVNVVDLTIRDINAIGGASWNAYTDFENTDAGNNDGWNFSLSPPYSTAELPVTLRSFTQPRRF